MDKEMWRIRVYMDWQGQHVAHKYKDGRTPKAHDPPEEPSF